MKASSFFLLPLATLACAGPLTGGMYFTLSYYPSGGAVPPSVPSCSGPIVVTVTDAREKPAEAGHRFEENKPDVVYPIKIEGDAAAYVRSALEANLKRAGSPGEGQSTSTLAATLVKLTLEERTYHNAEFSGEVGLDLVLATASSPAPCWKGRILWLGHQLRQGRQPRELPGDPEPRGGEGDSRPALREIVPGRAVREMFPALISRPVSAARLARGIRAHSP